MAFESMISTGHGGRGGSVFTDRRGLAITKNNIVRKGDIAHAVTIRLGPDLVSEMRWVIGDYIELLFDRESSLGLLKRALPGGRGWKLCPPGESSKELAGRRPVGNTQIKGTPSPLFIEAAFGDGSRTLTPENIVVNPDGIVFDVRRPHSKGTK